MDKPKRWSGVGQAVGVMLSAFSLLSFGLLIAADESPIPGLSLKWALFCSAVALVLCCAWWVWSTHRRFHKFCDRKERRTWLYARLAELSEEGRLIYVVARDCSERPDLAAQTSPDSLADRTRAWDARIGASFRNTDWESKFSPHRGPLESFQDIRNFVSARKWALAGVESDLDRSAHD